MINISDVVEQIVVLDNNAQESIRKGILNYSSYARLIKTDVEMLSAKKVKLESIVVALTRLAKKMRIVTISPLDVRLQHLSVHSNLEEVTFEKSTENIRLLREVNKRLPQDLQTFFTITQSISEITIIAESKVTEMVRSVFADIKPAFAEHNLAGVTVKFAIDYLAIPNLIFELTRILALQQINLIEIVSTTTELTFIINREDTERTVAQLSKIL